LVAKSDALAHSLAEPHADVIVSLAKGFSHVVASHGPYGKNVFPRAAALLDVSPISDVVEIDSTDTFKRPIYAGKSFVNDIRKRNRYYEIERFYQITDCSPNCIHPCCCLWRLCIFRRGHIHWRWFEFGLIVVKSKWVSETIAKSDRPELGAAKIVVSGGRGLKNKENFALMYALADKLGAAGKQLLSHSSRCFSCSC
jgi:electron transfer flavoprotein alpha subunit